MAPNKQKWDEFLPLEKAFRKHNWTWWPSKDLFDNIKVSRKDDMYLYNYNDKHKVPKDHPVLVKCRGLVIREDGEVLCYPFDRFFNYFEKECKELDWNSAEILSKEDGSLVNCFWKDNHWEITTRGSFYPNNSDTNFAELFKEHFKGWDKLTNEKICWIFELVTKKNRIVKWYDHEGVYLIGARSLDDIFFGYEFCNDFLDLLAKRLGVLRPKRYSAIDLDGCKQLFGGKEFIADDEGLVVVDKNFNRMKIKQESYIKLSKIKMLSPQHIFEYILGLTEIDEEYLQKCPEVMDELRVIQHNWNCLLVAIESVFDKIKNLPTRKEFAAEANKYPYKAILFQKLGGKVDYSKLKWKEVEKW